MTLSVGSIHREVSRPLSPPLASCASAEPARVDPPSRTEPVAFSRGEREAFARVSAQRARPVLRQRSEPATGWRLHSGPLQTVRVNDASPSAAAPPGPSTKRWALFAVATLFVAGAAFAGSALTTFAYQFFAGRKLTSTTTEVRGTRSVITAIRDLATLESASYHMERVIDLRDRQSHLFGLFESQDAILLVASADVVAGVDLQSMRDGDITVDEQHRTVSITLPEPIILSSRLDNDNTYVHSRVTDNLALPAHTLETRARQLAEQTLREAALEAGILARARGNAGVTLKTLLHSLGFHHVEVVFRAE
ncbi:MAG TPA: DUF4230 domain-containing protein [Polyangiales bacterium]